MFFGNYHKYCLNLAVRNFMIHSKSANGLDCMGPYVMNGEMVIFITCPACKNHLELVITDDPLQVQRVIYIHKAGKSITFSLIPFFCLKSCMFCRSLGK